MTRCEKLLAKARNNPAGLRFRELERLAECYGFTLERQKGSHRAYTRAGFSKLLNLQPDKNGMAKPYQMKELLRYLDEIDRA